MNKIGTDISLALHLGINKHIGGHMLSSRLRSKKSSKQSTDINTHKSEVPCPLFFAATEGRRENKKGIKMSEQETLD